MMALATGLYWTLVGAVAYGAAATVAGILRRRGRQERGVWVAGLGVSLVLPFALPTLGTMSLSPAPSVGLGGPQAVIDLTPIRVGVAEAASTAWMEPALLAAWAVASVLLLARFLTALRIVHTIREQAVPTEATTRLRVSERHGPAVVGFLRPTVLVPDWVMRLPIEPRGWILRHEAEHIRGRDPWLLALVVASRIALPWNPVVWAFGRSIRAAIETDCDRRTIGVTGDALSYGEALLAVAAGPRDPYSLPAMAPGFAERHVKLSHRIEMLARPYRGIGPLTRVGLMAVVVAATAAACEVPAPTVAPTEEPEAIPQSVATSETGVADAVSSELSSEPVFFPYDVAPSLLNRSAVAGVLESEYPPLLKEAGIGGTVSVWVYVDASGKVGRAQINESSGLDALDDAAMSVATSMEFSPARNRGENTPVWVSMPITFNVGR